MARRPHNLTVERSRRRNIAKRRRTRHLNLLRTISTIQKSHRRSIRQARLRMELTINPTGSNALLTRPQVRIIVRVRLINIRIRRMLRTGHRRRTRQPIEHGDQLATSHRILSTKIVLRNRLHRLGANSPTDTRIVRRILGSISKNSVRIRCSHGRTQNLRALSRRTRHHGRSRSSRSGRWHSSIRRRKTRLRRIIEREKRGERQIQNTRQRHSANSQFNAAAPMLLRISLGRSLGGVLRCQQRCRRIMGSIRGLLKILGHKSSMWLMYRCVIGSL